VCLVGHIPPATPNVRGSRTSATVNQLKGETMAISNDSRNAESRREEKGNASNPITHGWDHAVELFHEFIGPLPERAKTEARRRYLNFCRLRDANDRLNEAAPLVAFGFLTRAAFDDARRTVKLRTTSPAAGAGLPCKGLKLGSPDVGRCPPRYNRR